MSFYNIREDMGLALNDILRRVFFNSNEYSKEDIAITWINYKTENKNVFQGCGFAINNNKTIYPASIVKLIYGLAAYCWIKNGRILISDEISDAVRKMLFHSSNNATSFVVDLLTGTTSGPCLSGKSWKNWKYQRFIINDWLNNLNWEELYGINCCQKTWDDQPFGREKEFYGYKNKNRNAMSTDATARVLEEIMIKIDYQINNLNLRNCLKRNLNKLDLQIDPLNQVEGFLGEGLPETTNFWSKAGLMSEVRHDAAWWRNNRSVQTLLVVFANGKKYVNDTSLFPALAREIYNYSNSSFF